MEGRSTIRVRGTAAMMAVLATLTVAATLVTGAARADTAGVVIFPDPTADAGLSHIVPGPDGALYFTENNAFQIGRITTAGQITETPVPESQTTVQTGTAGQGPNEIASSDGKLWFLSDTQSRLFSLTPGGTLTEAPGDGYTSADGAYVDDPMGGLAASDQGGVWTQGLLAGSLRLWAPDGSGYSDYAFPDNNHSLHPMTLGPDGRVYLGYQNTDGQYIDSDGDGNVAPQNIPVNVVDHTYEISSLAFSSTGTLWFTEEEPADPPFPASGGAIGSYTPGTATATATATAASTQKVQANLVPHSLVAGPGGFMYFVAGNAGPNHTDGAIGQISPSGQISVADLGAYQPTDLAYGSDGNLWFIDNTDNAIGAVAPTSLFPGAPGPVPAPVTPTPVAPAPTPTPPKTKAPPVTLTLSPQTLQTVRSHGVLKVRCTLAGAGTCAATATIAARSARQIGLKPARKAKTFALGHARKVFTKQGAATLSIPLSRKVGTAIARVKKLPVTVTVTSSASGASSRTASHQITLTRAKAKPPVKQKQR